MPDAKKTATLYSLVLLSLIIITTILYVSSRAFMPEIIVRKSLTTEQLEAVPAVLSKMDMDEDAAIILIKELKSSDVKNALKAVENQSVSDPKEKVKLFLQSLLPDDFEPGMLEKLASQGDVYTKAVQIIDLLQENENRIALIFPYFKSSIIEVLKKSKSENHGQKN